MGILKKRARKNSGRPFDELRFENLIGSVYRRRGSLGKDAYFWTLNSVYGTGDKRSVRHSLRPEDVLQLPTFMNMLATWIMNRDDIDESLRSDLKNLLTWSSLVGQMMFESTETDTSETPFDFNGRH